MSRSPISPIFASSLISLISGNAERLLSFGKAIMAFISLFPGVFIEFRISQSLVDCAVSLVRERRSLREMDIICFILQTDPSVDFTQVLALCTDLMASSPPPHVILGCANLVAVLIHRRGFTGATSDIFAPVIDSGYCVRVYDKVLLLRSLNVHHQTHPSIALLMSLIRLQETDPESWNDRISASDLPSSLMYLHDYSFPIPQ